MGRNPYRDEKRGTSSVSEYAPVHHAIWNDDDFLALEPEAKLVYFLLFTHRKLSRCGCLDLMPSRWAKATGYDLETLTAALSELSEARFVVIDPATEELVVRTKVKHDKPGRWTQIKAVWRAWETVESQTLRDWLLYSFPEECWSDPERAPFPMPRRHEPPSDTPWHTPCDTPSVDPGRATAPSTSTLHPAPLTDAHPPERSVTYETAVASVEKLKYAKKAGTAALETTGWAAVERRCREFGEPSDPCPVCDHGSRFHARGVCWFPVGAGDCGPCESKSELRSFDSGVPIPSPDEGDEQ
jgi:hypothetical protein